MILTQKARNQLKLIDRLGLAKLPVCMAKTQYSVSDDPKAVGAPTGFRQVTVSELRIAAGAGFIVAVTGAMMTMPGLPRRPASEAMDVPPTAAPWGSSSQRSASSRSPPICWSGCCSAARRCAPAPRGSPRGSR